MSRAKKNPILVWHVSAGFTPPTSMENYWHNSLKWKSKGYVAIIETNGDIWWLWENTNKIGGYKKEYNPKCWEFITNGVAGFNERTNNVCTIGGVENKGTKDKPIWKAKDTRTDAQKKSQYEVMYKWMDWMKANGGDLSKTQITGHYQFSIDKNNNGIIESWERIKECPCYDANEEFRWLMVTKDNKANELPTKK